MKRIINTERAPAPIGPYNQAILVNDTLYTSGQIAINPNNGELVTHSVTAEATQVLENLKAVLEAADMDFSNVVKATIFLIDLNEFHVVNEIYSQYINAEMAPARECVQVAELPKKVNVEISVIAVR